MGHKTIYFYTLFLIFIINFNLQSQNGEFPSVKVQKVKKVTFSNELQIISSIIANETVNISSVVSEKIKKINFIEGSFIQSGKVLIELENNEERAILMQVKAELDEANVNYLRAKKLLVEGNASQSMLDKRLMQKKKLEGKLKEIQAKIDDLIIKSPFSGIIGTKNFSEGAYIDPGNIITTLYDISKVKLELYIPEQYINKISKNQEFFVTLPSIKKSLIKGRIFAVDPYINNETRTFKAIGMIKDNTNYIIKPGMMANIKLNLEAREALVIPEGSIIPEDEKSYVLLVEKNKVKKVNVLTGKRKNGFIEIIENININDYVIYEGTNKVRDGSEVLVIK